MRGAVLALTVGLMAHAAVAAPALEPGVSRELAQWRAKTYRDVRYALAISVAAGATKLAGTAKIEVTLPRRAPDLVLDWRPLSGAARVGQLRVNGKPAKAKLEQEHLIVPARLLRAGRNRVTFSFESPIALSGSAVTRYVDREDGSEYVYTLFVPSDASSAFPCFDQPDLKARFSLELVLPRAWTAVGNAPIAAIEDVSNSLRRFRFAATPPISTYLFAFAAGPFAELTESSRPTRLFVRKSQLARARTEAPEVLRLNRESVRWFERYFDSRFPFPKYDLVLVPEFAYGGMEHAGATFLREDAVLFPSAPNETDILARAQLLFHESSHQWFGDSVTMRWFDDLWLKEGFANFMAAKAAEALLPAHSVWNAFHALKSAAYRTDVTQGTTPIYRPLANLSAAKSAYGNIVYAKAPAVLRQAEFYVGARVFRRAVRQFLKSHAYAAADWNDLVAALERASGRRLKGWAEAWVKRRGMPEVRLAWDTDREGRPRNVVLEQHNVLNEGGTWPMKLKVFALPESGLPRSADALLRGESARVRAIDGMPEIEFAFANSGDYGYGRFLLDPASRDAVLARPEIVQGDLLRALVFGSLWESVRDAELSPLDYLDLVVRVAPVERDAVTLAGLLQRAQVAFLHYVSDSQRDALAPRFEHLLAEGMLRADTPGRRITFLRTFTASAWSEGGRSRLKSLLANTLEIPGVKLSSRDRFRAIARLLALDDPEAQALLSEQIAADSGDDGRRYAFAAAAAERSAEAKRVYFERFFNEQGLPESWIDAALGPFNAVEHAELTQPYLDLALAALPEFKRTRKIFFVNNWLAAFIGGQVDVAALEQVESFARQPELEPDLKLQLLEAMDGLARTVKIRARFARLLP
ncbi:MAG TPA: M1 family aminopeptidase [Burkholderiales bacterium]|nr:M1 family aminopeptidase [Burkholderiales bacterium]